MMSGPENIRCYYGYLGHCRMLLPPRGGGGGTHETRPGVGKSVYLWTCKEVDVLYIVEIGIDI